MKCTQNISPVPSWVCPSLLFVSKWLLTGYSLTSGYLYCAPQAACLWLARWGPLTCTEGVLGAQPHVMKNRKMNHFRSMSWGFLLASSFPLGPRILSLDPSFTLPYELQLACVS